MKNVLTIFITFMQVVAFAQNYCYNKQISFNTDPLHYEIYYTWGGLYMPAGKAYFANIKRKNKDNLVYEFTGGGTTYKSYDWFYKVRDTYKSIADTQSLLPFYCSRDVQEGRKKYFEEAHFDTLQKKIQSAKNKYTWRNCTYDPLSAIFLVRSLSFATYKQGDKLPLYVYLYDSVYTMYVKYNGIRNYYNGKTNQEVIVLKPLLVPGSIFKGGEEMTVFVSNDSKRIPLYVETPIVVGKIKVYIKN